ncbi:7 transmembrane receptor (rhodopsin family) domain-containing protein [Phthorimaea operculella]|nr:7 transmembrane receptor (rhodopsin family) domain-containing protein [Phthorimaea operculella]
MKIDMLLLLDLLFKTRGCVNSKIVYRNGGAFRSCQVLYTKSRPFFAVLYPLRLPVARRRSKQMLYIAWAVALACSLPQSVVFRVKRHPHVAEFEQCVSFDAFSTAHQEITYNVFCLCAMYFMPLVIITVCYVCIFCEIRKSSKELDEKCHNHHTSNGAPHVRLRRSDRRVLERARRRTLRMTVTIVSVFALCWLPYATMAMCLVLATLRYYGHMVSRSHSDRRVLEWTVPIVSVFTLYWLPYATMAMW